MNKYQIKIIQRHYLLYINGCRETLDILCPTASTTFEDILQIYDKYSSNLRTDDYFMEYLESTYDADWYPKIKTPSLWKRFKRWIMKHLW